MKIRLARKRLERGSIVDGEGIRAVLWTQGCSHNCLGCHNPETHSFNAGYLLDIEEVKKDIDSLDIEDGITLTGGDPLYQVEAVNEIAKYAKKKGLNVWCYTGFTFEEIYNIDKYRKFLSNVDVLVDGEFILEQRSLSTIFRGSKNQRIINVKESLKKNKVCTIRKYDEIQDKQIKSEYIFI